MRKGEEVHEPVFNQDTAQVLYSTISVYTQYSKSNTVQSTGHVMPVPGNVLRAAILFANEEAEAAKLLHCIVLYRSTASLSSLL
jgi:hypothetical protein